MKNIVSLLIYFLPLLCTAQYTIERVLYDNGALKDTLYGKENTDSLFRKDGANYDYAMRSGFKKIIDGNGIINLKTVNFESLLGDGNLVIGGSAAWGSVTGTLSNQTDLNNALAGKQAAGSYATGTGTANGTNTGDQTTVSGNAGGLSAPLSFANGGVTGTAATPATTGAMTVSMATAVITITPTGACTFNASGGVAGQLVTFIITTSGTSSFVLTFGTNFRKVGTLATGTTSARFFAVTFRCVNGTIWQEISRTAAQT